MSKKQESGKPSGHPFSEQQECFPLTHKGPPLPGFRSQILIPWKRRGFSVIAQDWRDIQMSKSNDWKGWVCLKIGTGSGRNQLVRVAPSSAHFSSHHQPISEPKLLQTLFIPHFLQLSSLFSEHIASMLL